MATAPAVELTTAEEFGKRPDPGYPEELVRGKIIRMTPPDRLHGYVCYVTARLLGAFVEVHDLGRVMTNDSGVITEREPDTVRGADVCFYSYERLPRGPIPRGYGSEIPELVIEVRSPSNRWRDLHDKVAEYLRAGVLAVVVLDPERTTAHVFGPDEAPVALTANQDLTLPGILPGFTVRVGRLFE